MLLLAIPFGLPGARLLHVLDDFSYFWHHPGQIMTLQSELLHGVSIALWRQVERWEE
jgi:prolipoprotein diacylglyceryltransferase